MTEFRKIANKNNVSSLEISRRFGIPKRTVEAWSSGERTPPGYVLDMIKKLLNEKTTS